jgi:hypothetical protein
MSIRYISSAGRGLLPLAAALVVAVSAPAAAQEPTAMQKFFGAIGLLELPKDPIDYRERAPLVVPPSSGLIAPRNPDDIRAVNPDWPVDHDARFGNNRNDRSHMATDNQFYTGNPLSPDERARGRISRQEDLRRQEAARRAGEQTAGGELAAGKEHLGPDGLGFKGWDKKQEKRVVFTGEPERRYLTEPPPGLRTPSLNAPYGVVTTSPGPQRVKEDRSALPDDTGGRR